MCWGYARSAKIATVAYSDLRVEADGGELLLAGKTDRRARLTHFATGQLCTAVQAPADFIRSLPATLASQVLNHRFRAIADRKYDARVLFHENGSLIARSITSELYDRVWNYELIDKLILPLERDGFRAPPARPSPGRENDPRVRPATEADIIKNQRDFGLAVKVGDPIAPAGRYASDHDMFVFLVNTNHTFDIGGRSLIEGVFVSNSEVGAGKVLVSKFLMDGVCGNHICWGVTDVQEVSVIHKAGRDTVDQGATLRRFISKFEIEMRKCLTDDSHVRETEQKIAVAQRVEIAGTKDELIDALYKWCKSRGLTALGKKVLTAGYETAERHVDWYGSPRTVFGMVSGLTEYSQTIPYADQRHEIDVQAGRIMEIAF